MLVNNMLENNQIFNDLIGSIFDSTSVFDLFEVEIYDNTNDVPLFCRKFNSLESAKRAIRCFVYKSNSIDSLKFWITINIYDIETFNLVDFRSMSMTYYANCIFNKKEVD